VIIMAMLAEGVAKTLEQDNVVMAVWRAVWTIVLALVIVVIDTGASRFTYQFPELILTQLISVVFISEFFDLRLLEKWPSRISRYFAGVRPWYEAKPRVAVVRNREEPTVIGRLGRPAPGAYRKQKVQRHVDALREQGFEVKVFEGDTKLLGQLGKFLPSDPQTGAPGGIVLNLATGVQGAGRFAQIPAMLELAGVAYTGPDPAAHAQLGDRFALMSLLADAGIGVPRFRLVDDANDTEGVTFPAAVRPRLEPDSRRTVVRNERSLRSALREIRSTYGQPAIVEEIVSGREVRVSLIGNDDLECLPLLEYARGADGKTCPALLADGLAAQVRECARQTFRALRCRDYARIDIRLTQFGEPVVIDVSWHGLFARRGSFVNSAETAGYGFGVLLRRIVTEAARRYVSDRREDDADVQPPSVVSLADRRAAAG
jgi:D-alanine-D-alanine ligase